MKKTLFLLAILFSTLSFSQRVFEISFRHVPIENMDEFENLEINYWSKVVSDGIKNGQQISWSLHKRLDAGMINFNEDEATHAFVNVFENMDQYLNSIKVWQNAPKILGPDSDRFSTSPISKTLMIQRYIIEDNLDSGEQGSFAIWNYAKPKDLNGFISENSKLWKPYFKNNMKKSDMVAWGVGSRIYPANDNSSTAMTWDIFKTLKGAMSHLSSFSVPDSVLKKSKMNEYNPDGFRYRIIWQTLKRAN